MKQKTIKNEFSLEGVGLHTGHKTKVVFKPSDANSGIVFNRIDLEGSPSIKVRPESILIEEKVPRCTSIGTEDTFIHTVEHAMSAIAALGITNLGIDIDNDELPGLDGSGLEFLNKLKSSGIVEQNGEVNPFRVQEPIGVERNGSSLYVMPANDFQVSYTLDYNHSFLKSQYYSVSVNAESFEKEIAPSRTFVLEEEAQELQKQGLGKGANYKNTLVVGNEGVIENKFRFENEFARHKILDFIGDISLLGVPICGHVFAVKSGHTLNIQLLKEILKQKQRFEQKGIVDSFDISGKREIGIEEIMKILPHRYPFLLVDRVVEIEEGKKAVGIKNVTINDNFFQGHFPTRPVMPGVMMVEAMAQTAGVVVLTNKAHRGKVAFFMGVDKVKFRKVVSPGDQLIMEVEVLRDKSRTAQIRAKSTVEGEVVAEADMIFSFTDNSYLD